MGAEEEKLEVKLEEEEQSRPNRNPNPNSISQDQFLSWKRHKEVGDSSRKEEAARKRAEDVIAGTVPMNGRELFLHEPWVLLRKVKFANLIWWVLSCM
ncbi:hypothetical protein C5167_007743 [Papaver somniferum]|nr:hypothetical protein C5167_007743 [Papaver somniferum]